VEAYNLLKVGLADANDALAEERNFDATWWNRFYEKTGCMSRCEVFKDTLDRAETAKMRRDVLDMIAETCLERRLRYGIRLWVDGTQIDNLDPFFDTPPLPHEDIGDWTTRVFGKRKYGIIFNRGEKFSDHLSRSMVLKLGPLIDKIGMPTEGFLFTIFIGNYDNTPLGIHKDLPGKSVMHFHLGPGPKTMYTWDDQPYSTHAAADPSNAKQLAKHAHYSLSHTFDEGDIYFMPENRFHIGTQSGLSVGIACWCNNRSVQDMTTRLFTLFARDYIRSSPAMLKADPSDLNNTDHIEQVLDLYDMPKELADATMKDVLRYVYRDLRYALYSNGGLRNGPLPRKDRITLRENSIVQVEHPYKMLHYASTDGSRLSLFSRGTRLEMHFNPAIIRIVERINQGEAASIKELEELSAPDLPALGVRQLLQQLRTFRGIFIE
jgi:hypothetical protein